MFSIINFQYQFCCIMQKLLNVKEIDKPELEAMQDYEINVIERNFITSKPKNKKMVQQKNRKQN